MRYFIALGGLILVAMLVIGVLISYLPNRQPNQEGKRVIDLVDHLGPNDVYSLRITGRITAPEDHYEVLMRVSQQERRIEVTRGYDGTVIERETLPNTPASFDEFARALGGAGFALERDVSVEEPRGVCPEGRRYSYRLVSDSETVFDTWSTSCSRSDGNFGGDDRLVQKLFKEQIPEYNSFVRGLRL